MACSIPILASDSFTGRTVNHYNHIASPSQPRTGSLLLVSVQERPGSRTRVGGSLAGKPIAIALIVVLAAEISLRGLSPFLPAPNEWHTPYAQAKISQLDQMRRLGARADIVFAGNSMVAQGVSPSVFTVADPLHRTSYNAGLDGAFPPVLERWLTEEVVPRAKPRMVVYGLSSLDFAEGQGFKALKFYNQGRRFRRGLLGRLDRVAARYSKLIYFRPMLANPETYGQVVHELLGDLDSNDSTPSVGPAGEFMPIERNSGQIQQQQNLVRRLLADFAVGQKETEALERTVKHLKTRGVGVVLVHMPVAERYADLHRGGADQYHQFQRHLRRTADRLGVSLLDMSGGFAESHFEDYTHLSPEGANLLSRRLAIALP